MMITSVLTKRWIMFGAVMFLVLYLVNFVLFTLSNVLSLALLLDLSNFFALVWIVCVSFLYFRRAQNNWSTRLVTAIGWIGLLILISAFLAGPVYGYAWATMMKWDVVRLYWMHATAVLIGGVLAPHSAHLEERLPKQITPGI